MILTVNTNEPKLIEVVSSQPWTFKLILIQNAKPKGFGANHNAAFSQATLDNFCVLNPDVDFDSDPFTDLLFKLGQPSAGCAFPVQLDEAGQVQDYARKLPSPVALFKRYFGARTGVSECKHPDWVNGAFMLFPARVFNQIKGFDEKYFMYCEDVDICLRLQLAGFKLSQSTATVVHAAQRNTRANLRHLIWHVTSLLRLWTSPAYWKYWMRRRNA